jgi:hypothetical protein
MKFLNLLGMSVISRHDDYFLIDVTVNDLIKHGPMNRDELEKFILSKFQDQPIKYFNENSRLKIFHPRSGKSWSPKLSITFDYD